jgi:hypothetical protein
MRSIQDTDDKLSDILQKLKERKKKKKDRKDRKEKRKKLKDKLTANKINNYGN